MVDAAGCDVAKISDKNNVAAFATELVKRIDMKAYGKPTVKHFGDGNKEGFTLIQLIETSNIAAHFVNEDGSMYLDVFSCKEFDQATVIETVKEFFGAQRYNHTYLQRQAPSLD